MILIIKILRLLAEEEVILIILTRVPLRNPKLQKEYTHYYINNARLS